MFKSQLMLLQLHLYLGDATPSGTVINCTRRKMRNQCSIKQSFILKAFIYTKQRHHALRFLRNFFSFGFLKPICISGFLGNKLMRK